MMDGQEPQFENERRLILAILLSGAVLFLFPYIYRYLYPPPDMEPVGDQTQQSETIPESESAPAPEAATPAGESAAQVAEAETPVEPITSAQPRQITVENEDLVLRFSNVGAVPVSIHLKGYRDAEGNPLELLPQTLPEGSAPPFSLSLFDEAASGELAQAVFELEGEVPETDSVQAPVELRFRYRSSRLDVTRRFQIPASGFQIPTRTELLLQQTPVPHRIRLGPAIGPLDAAPSGGWMSARGDFFGPQLAYRVEDSVERVSKVEEDQSLNVHPEWVAFDSQYFTYLIMSPQIVGLQLHGETLERSDEEGKSEEIPLLSAEVEVAPDSSSQLFFGPKDLGILRSVDPSLPDLVNFGYFGILVEPLLFALKAVHGVVGNYGWSIIILTFFINLILLPIRYKQTTSMKKMSQIQPQMKAIQERYKKLDRSDPKRQEMNKEIMELYQKHGVNPLGGCLPLLVQMPFLFAFYRMLAKAIELREAPFMFWIKDLSKPDPYYVTPIVMGVSMIVQQQIMPSTADNAQRRMMLLMPIVFTYLFLSYSSGLALYFLFSNLFGTAFQVGMQRMRKEEEVKPSSKPKGPSKKGKAKNR